MNTHRTYGLLRSEVRKALTMPATFGMVAAIAGLTALNTALAVTGPDPTVDGAEAVRRVFGAGRDFLGLFVALGAIGAAAEFRHATAVPTFLTTPARHRVLWAKMVAYLPVGLMAAVIVAAAQMAIALPMLAADGRTVPLFSGQVVEPVLGGVAAATASSALGVAIGLLVRSQVVALMAAVGWFVVLEPAITIVAPDVARLLPGALLPGGLSSAVDGTTLDPLAAHVALPLLAAYVVGLSVFALRTTLRRDIA